MKTRRGWVQGYDAQAVVTPGRLDRDADYLGEQPHDRARAGLGDVHKPLDPRLFDFSNLLAHQR